MVDRHEQFARVRVDAKLDVGVGQIDAISEFVVDGPPDLPSDIHRADREALLASARADRERARRQPAHELDRGLGGAAHLGLDPQRRLDDAQAGKLHRDLECARHPLRRRDDEERGTAPAELDLAGSPHRPPQVAFEHRGESRTPATLERELAEHEQRARRAAGRDRRGAQASGGCL